MTASQNLPCTHAAVAERARTRQATSTKGMGLSKKNQVDGGSTDQIP